MNEEVFLKRKKAIKVQRHLRGSGLWVLAVLLLALGALALYWRQTHPPAVVVPNPQAAEEALERQTYQAFRRQDKKDELQKLTENSFLDSRLKPLAGRPVLLAAGVKTWDGKHAESDEAPNLVKFQIIQGKGRLVFFKSYIPGQPVVGNTETQLITLAMDGYEAFVWLITDPDSQDEVVVKASLAPVGERAGFIDPQSEALFHVHPVAMTPDWEKKDVRVLCAQTYRNDSRPHAQVVDQFLFTYPSSVGVYKRDPTARIYEKGHLKFWRLDVKRTVVEALSWEERKDWKWEREKWHTIPPDLSGFVTHVDATGEHFGTLTYSQYDPLYGGQGNDQFRQGRWQLGEYLTKASQAGPEDLWLLKTQEEDANSPIEVEVSRTHHTGLGLDHGVSYWGETTHWICATGNLRTIYDMSYQKIVSFRAGKLPAVEEMKTQLSLLKNPIAPSTADQPVDYFFKSLGFSFRDITPRLESRFQKLGHPPGPMVTQVDSRGPLGLSGLMPEDVIVMADWVQTTNSEGLQKVLEELPANKALTLVYWRQGSYHWVF